MSSNGPLPDFKKLSLQFVECLDKMLSTAKTATFREKYLPKKLHVLALSNANP